MSNDESKYAYLLIRSDDLGPDELTRRIGAKPSEVLARGSRREGPPPVPRSHIWTYRPKGPPGVQLEAHLKAVEAFLAAHAAGLRALADEDLATITLEIVRKVADAATQGDLGLSLNSELLNALTDAGATLDIDEYPA